MKNKYLSAIGLSFVICPCPLHASVIAAIACAGIKGAQKAHEHYHKKVDKRYDKC